MSGQGAGEGREERPHEAQLLSARRLFLIVVLFLVLAAYSIWNSDRFQTIFQGVSQQRLSELLQRPVSFRRVDFHDLPALDCARRRAHRKRPAAPGGAAALGRGADDRRRRLGHGRRAAASVACGRSRPEITLVQFADGTWNLPPGLTGPAEKGGLSVRVGELVVQQRRLPVRGARARASTAASRSSRWSSSTLGERALRGTAGMPPCARSDCPAPSRWCSASTCASGSTPARGASIEALRIVGEFGELNASGSVENFKDPTTLLLHVGRAPRRGGRAHLPLHPRVRRRRLGPGGDPHPPAGRVPHRGEGPIRAHRREGLSDRGDRGDGRRAARGARRADREGALRRRARRPASIGSRSSPGESARSP